jgi:ankyrin repeat protein
VARKRKTIFDAIASGEPSRVKRVLTRSPEALEERDEEGLSPLMRAAYEGRPEVVDVLVARGAEIGLFEAAALGRVDLLRERVGRSKKRANAFAPDGFTPLHLAAYFGHAEAAALLLDRGADVAARSKNRRLFGLTPLASAAAGRHAEVVELLLARGADPNAGQPGGWRPLHWAALNGDLRMARALVQHGADPRVLADDRTRPLDFAIEKRHHELVGYLKTARPKRARRA